MWRKAQKFINNLKQSFSKHFPFHEFSALFISLELSILALQLESCNFSYPNLLYPSCMCQGQMKGGQRDKQPWRSFPAFGNTCYLIIEEKFSYLVAVIATTVSDSKDCLGAEAQENQEKKKKERMMGNFHTLSESQAAIFSFIKPELEASPGAFSVVLMPTFKFQAVSHSGLEIPEEMINSSPLRVFESSCSSPIFLLVFIFRVLKLLLHAFFHDFRLHSVGDIGYSMLTLPYPEVKVYSIDFFF